MQNHYETLGVENFADLQTVKKAFREFTRKLHPDKFEYGSEEGREAGLALVKYTDAYNPIKTQQLKDAYDRELRLYLKRHKPAADDVEATRGRGGGAKAWQSARPDARPEPEETTAEPKQDAPKAGPRQEPPQPEQPAEAKEEDPKTRMMRKRVEKAYKWDDDPEHTIDVRL